MPDWIPDAAVSDPGAAPRNRILVLGGERSGKSRFAHDLALRLDPQPLYIATARAWDAHFRARIDRHISERDPRFEAIVIEREIDRADTTNRVVVLDCVTLWLTNLYSDADGDAERAEREARDVLRSFASGARTVIVVSNELGMGSHAMTAIGRRFVELQGRINQLIAAEAEAAVLMIAGLPLFLKGSLPAI